MPVAFPRPWSAPRDAPLLQRSATLALVVALHLLLLFLLFRLAPPPASPEAPRAPLSVKLLPEPQVAPADTTRAAEAPRPKAGSARPRAPEPEPEPVPRPTPPATAPPPLPTPSIWSRVIPMTRQEMAAADISRFPSRSAATGGTGEGERGASADRGSGDPGPGSGPNGEPLYNADWYRRPTRAQLGFYLPSGGPREGWGMVACRTVPDYRVEDCREIAESPVGSGLSGAVRQAAWQFRVLPPRIGGRSLIGSWVRIRIEYVSDGPE